MAAFRGPDPTPLEVHACFNESRVRSKSRIMPVSQERCERVCRPNDFQGGLPRSQSAPRLIWQRSKQDTLFLGNWNGGSLGVTPPRCPSRGARGMSPETAQDTNVDRSQNSLEKAAVLSYARWLRFPGGSLTSRNSLERSMSPMPGAARELVWGLDVLALCLGENLLLGDTASLQPLCIP